MGSVTPIKPRAASASRSSSRTPTPAARTSDVDRLTSAATAWLKHPLASLYLLGATAALLLGIGVVMVWSASSVYSQTQFGDANYFLKRELIFAVVGVVACLVMTQIPMEKFKQWGWIIFGVAGLLMTVPLVRGYEVKGNKNWIDFGVPMLRFQPSELAKLAIILWAASIFTSKRRVLEDPQHLLIPFLPGALGLIGLTIMQRDLGTSVIMGLIVLALLWNVGGSSRILVAFLGIVIAGLVGLLLFGQGFRLQRIFGFLDPTFDPDGINYQPNQAQFGLATGGWWGLGLGYGRMKWGYLSEGHTDYILAVIGEELGLVGTLSVIALFVLLTFAGFRIALRSGSFYARVVAAGITCWISMQALINISVVLRLLPVMGVPLPLVSYGGSSLVVVLMAIGILLRCAREETAAHEYLVARAEGPNKNRLLAVLTARRPTS